VPSRRDCEELCLRERTFSCRSAEYDTVALTCALSRETRRTQPNAVRDARNVDYLENQCIQTSERDNDDVDVDMKISYFARAFRRAIHPVH